MIYNYKENIKNDIIDYIKENFDSYDEINQDELYDDLFIADSVTGNASGSYYCNAYKAEEALAHNLDLLKEACEEFCCVPDLENPEACDVTIRCYLIGQVLSDVLKELDDVVYFIEEFAKNSYETGQYINDYGEFSKLVNEEGYDADEKLYQLYIDKYDELKED